jgi:hypothetical protein
MNNQRHMSGNECRLGREPYRYPRRLIGKGAVRAANAVPELKEAPLRTAILVVLLLMVAGCGGSGGSGGGNGTTGSAEKLTGDLSYVRSGGFAGIRQKLTIHPDGRAEITSGKRSQPFNLPANELSKLAGAVDRADFASLPAKATGDKAVPDGFSHQLSYGGKQVQTVDFSVPDQLKPLLTQLQEILKKHVPR